MNPELRKKLNTGMGLTHSGRFHADDVISTCLLKLINPEIKIVRSNVIPFDFDGVIFDVGGGEYDHHQKNAPARTNGIPYAAFGLLWRDIADELVPKRNITLVDTVFVSEIDKCDNSPSKNLFSSSIENFNVFWDEERNENKAFEEAVNFFLPYFQNLISYFSKSNYILHYSQYTNQFLIEGIKKLYYEKMKIEIQYNYYSSAFSLWETYGHDIINNSDRFIKTFLLPAEKVYGVFHTSPWQLILNTSSHEECEKLIYKTMEREIKRLQSVDNAKEKLNKEYENSERKDIISLHQYLPFDTLLKDHPNIKAIVFPSNRGGYMILFPSSLTQTGLKFPTELCGQSGEEIRKYQKGLFFVHLSGTIGSCDSIEDAYEIYDKISLQINNI